MNEEQEWERFMYMSAEIYVHLYIHISQISKISHMYGK